MGAAAFGCGVLWPVVAEAAPEFQKKLSDLRLANLCEQWRAAEVIAEFESHEKAFVPAGGVVQRVSKGSFAEEHGIVPGSMLVRRGEYLYGASRTAFNPETYDKVNETAGELVWVSPDNVLHTTPIKKELMGVMFGDQRNMAAWFLGYGQRDSQWDELVVTALLTQGELPAVAESCWAAAVAKGYRADRLLHWCGMYLSLARGDYAGADAHASAYGEIVHPVLDADFPLRSADLSAVALQTGEVKRLVKMAEQFPHDGNKEANARYLGELAAKSPRPVDAPSKVAQRMKRRSFLKDDGTTTGPRWSTSPPGNPAGNLMPGLLKQGTVSATGDGEGLEFAGALLEVPVNHYQSGWLMPKLPARDVDVEMTFQMQPGKLANNEVARFNRTFSFGLCNNEEMHRPDRLYVPCLMAVVDYASHMQDNDPAIDVNVASRPGERNTYQVWSGYGPEQKKLATMAIPAFKLDKGEHRFRVTRVGDWAEMLLDGKRLALVPVPRNHEHPGFYFRIVGCGVTVKKLRADVLE